MAERVLLHVGMQKTGTTYLQAALVAAGRALREAGLVYPRPRVGSLLSHQLAFYGLVGPEIPHVTAAQAQQLRPQWDWLARRVAAERGTVLLSCESLSFIRARAAAGILDTLRGLGVRDVRVLITGRDVGRLVVSGWQQNVRNGRTAGLEGFLALLADSRALAERDTDDAERMSTWRAYSVAGVAQRWARLIGADRVAVVTTRPGAPSHVLWDRFLAASDLPGLAGLPAPEVPPDAANVGMRWAEADVIAALNAALVDARWPVEQARDLRAHIIRHGFLPRRDRGTPIAIPAHWQDRVAEWGRVESERLDTLVGNGLTVHGGLDDLRYQPSGPPDADPARGPEGRGYAERELTSAIGAAVMAAAGYVRRGGVGGWAGPAKGRVAPSTGTAARARGVVAGVQGAVRRLARALPDRAARRGDRVGGRGDRAAGDRR